MASNLPCLNCKADVAADDAKLFAGVFCCPTCYLIAERLEQRGTEELRWLLTIQREAIRIALIEGRLVLGPAEPTKDLSKKEVLEEVLRLSEKMDTRRNTPSKE